MSFYWFSCPACGDFEVEMPMSKYRHLDSCPTCKEHRPDRIWSVPEFIDGRGLNVRLPGINMNQNIKGEEQERRYGKMLDNARQLAWEKRERTKHGTKRDGEWRMTAQVPKELETALIRSTGNKDILRQETAKIIKKYDLGVDSG